MLGSNQRKLVQSYVQLLTIQWRFLILSKLSANCDFAIAYISLQLIFLIINDNTEHPLGDDIP